MALKEIHILWVLYIFLGKCSYTVDSKVSYRDWGRPFAGFTIKRQVSNKTVNRSAGSFSFLVWFGEGRWCTHYCCDVLPQKSINHTAGTSSVLCSMTKDSSVKKTSPRVVCTMADMSPLGYSKSNKYSFKEAGSGRAFTALGRYWKPRLWRTA